MFYILKVQCADIVHILPSYNRAYFAVTGNSGAYLTLFVQ